MNLATTDGAPLKATAPDSLTLFSPSPASRPEDGAPLKATSRVRVTYYESKRPLSVCGSSSAGSDECEPAAVRLPAAAVSVAEMPATYIVSR